MRIGTCSFADEALTKWFYPKGLPARERLPYYAERFDTVEIDSTYYHLPEEATTGGWAERTPDDFVFHVKAFGVMTRHPVRVQQLPPDLRDDAPVDDRGRVDRPSREFRAEIFKRFLEGVSPLRRDGKLGGILMQFPSYVVPKPASLDYLAWAREQLGDHEMLVEFRHASWFEEDARDETLRFLEEHGMTHVVTDSPRLDAKTVVPTVLAVTGPSAYMRFHGRNAETWHKRGGGASERFDYLYSDDELREWVEPLRELAGEAENAYVLFNNNNRSPGDPGDGRGFVAQAAANADRLRQILREAELPVS
ncbi:MAG: DUF72 domain-containing protein [Gaiellaceae bacterium]